MGLCETGVAVKNRELRRVALRDFHLDQNKLIEIGANAPHKLSRISNIPSLAYF